MATIRTYQPSEKQQQFHRHPAQYRLALGAWGSGKTTILIWEDILGALQYPGSVGVIYRKTYPALRDTTKRDYFRQCPPEFLEEVIKSEGREEAIFINGSRTLFRCLDDSRKLGSTQWDRVGIDEAWELEEDIYTTLAFGRLRGTVGPRKLVLASNPPNISHWLYDVFVANAGADTYVQSFSTYDNAANLPPGYIAKLETMTVAWKKKFLLGQWGVLAEGAPVYEDYREDIHVADLPTIKNRPVIRGWDFGFHHPACVWIQITESGHIHILHELLGKEEDLRHFARRVQQISQDEFPGSKFEDYCDVAGTQRQGVDLGKTAVQILHNEFSIFPGCRRLGLWNSIERIRYLLKTLANGIPLLRMRARCRLTRESFGGGYAMDRNTDLPKKDGFYDNIQDAFRYAAIGSLATTTPSVYEGKALPRRWRMAI